jgi:hypothetical protein
VIRISVDFSTGITLVLLKNYVVGCGMFNDGCSISDYAASDGKIINECLRKVAEGNDRGVLPRYFLE